ncbi:MAG: SpoIIE family protein phosphatase [Actinomycetota bacterium]|nr:SpoIIE family protein phosphatase [Actinomycetota bacterium]
MRPGGVGQTVTPEGLRDVLRAGPSPERSRSADPFPILAAKVALVGVAYYVAARLGLKLALIQRNVTPLWPPTGIAVVALLVLGRRVWPGILVAAFLVNLPISANALAAVTTAVGNTLAPFLAAWLLARVGFRWQMDRQRDALAIVFLGALSMLVSASIGTATLLVSGDIPASRFLPAWAVWWAGDAMGVLAVAPFLLSLGQFRTPGGWTWRQWAEAATLLVLVAGGAVAVTNTHVHLLFLIVPLLGWMAWRFQLRGAAPVALIAAGAAAWAAAHGSGPFTNGTLFSKMLPLQAFNGTAALTSLFFAAVVTERLRAREALERSAAELEGRVEARTAELSSANDQLTREIAERREVEDRLRQRERQLAEAQRVARIGSWEWLIPENRVFWSDEMFRIHGHRPQAFPVTFERAIAQVLEEDALRIRANAEATLREARKGDRLGIEYRIVRPDGVERDLLAKSKVYLGSTGEPVRMVGTVQDVTESKRAEAEHRIAETLQRSLLPERLPVIPGVVLAARYAPASAEMEIGGDWYDVVQLPNGSVGLAIGDVAGHGLRAASIMGQLRMALRAYAMEEDSPAGAISRVDQLVHRLALPHMATLAYLVFDPESGVVRFANAGHPPPLLIPSGGGEATYLEEALAPPLGAEYPGRFLEGSFQLAPGSTVLLFTDGLVEKRGGSIVDGLARLKEEAAGGGEDLEALCDHLLRIMVGGHIEDDIALVAMRTVPLGDEVRLSIPADPQVLAPLRRTLRRWLRQLDASTEETNAILVACGEACTNAIQHAYGAGEGMVEVELRHDAGTVEVVVRDHGRWRPSGGPGGGRGLALMRGFVDAVEVDTGAEGTVVRLRKRLAGASGPGSVAGAMASP